MTTIELDPGESAVAHQVAALRNYVNAAVGIDKRRQDGGVLGSPTKLDLIGMAGELAFAKWLGRWPDLTASVRAGEPDFRVDGHTFDVKATHHQPGQLLCPEYAAKRHVADVYVLAVVKHRRHGYDVEFPGWALGAELIRPEQFDTKFTTPCYAMTRDKLHTWAESWREMVA